jgi:hypothetical protein
MEEACPEDEEICKVIFTGYDDPDYPIEIDD